MIHFLAMAELVDHDIVKDLWRSKDESPVEIEIAVGRTAAPSCLLIADGNFSIVNLQDIGIKPHPLWNIFFGGLSVRRLQPFFIVGFILLQGLRCSVL